ncbi:MAG: hypothetical protein Q9197_004558 [Variospora fuerteventurae]
MDARASRDPIDPASEIELVNVAAEIGGNARRQELSTSHQQAETSRRPTYRSLLQTWWADNIQPTITHGTNGSPGHRHDPRDYLALERTYLGHLRTANALILFGVVLVQLFRLQNAESTAGVIDAFAPQELATAIIDKQGPSLPLKMFKKDISPGAKSKVKSSVQRAIRTKITETYPLLAPHIDEIIPKKSQLDLLKLPDRITLYALDTTPLFFQHMDDPLIPHLRIVHQFPACFPRIRIDRGAIRFVLSGATLMAPGLTSAGGRLPTGEPAAEDADESDKRYEGRELNEGEVVVVEAEGKDEACMIGQLRVGTREVKEKKKGVVIDTGHYLGDGLWKMVLD